ncbi:hypothetical protein [Pelagibacterium sediminicola]|uniref:hypothetical protein n=1 Tax=Pelagibacterium sediminicola TaxID=2248761 RepID=UPI000E31DB51|nr:hypothetical protein [Pelagibacterium sediminicola]
MADYRELLRRAIDALPENTGANRRAVYEKARGALVTQLRAIEPPLPAREITTHRLNLEDCIRQVEQEATDRLLGRLREVEDEPPAPVPAEPEMIEAEEPIVDEEPVAEEEPQYEEAEAVEPEPVFDDTVEDIEPDAGDDGESDRFEEPVLVPASEPAQSFTVASSSSIEDIIAEAEAATVEEPQDAAEEAVVPEPAFDDAPPLLDDPAPGPDVAPEPEHHFIASPREVEPRVATPLVDLHGRPLARGKDSTAEPEAVIAAAMSSVREVELEPAPRFDAEVSDAQVAIDRAIAALDREARGETPDEKDATPASDVPLPEEEDRATDEAADGTPRGVGALTVFLLIAVLLLGGGGAVGFWAWQQGSIDLNAIFAQSSPAEPSNDVAEVDGTQLEAVPEPAGNTTPEVPETPGVNGEAMPGEELPFVETETPGQAGGEPEIAFEDRLPAEAEESLNGAEETISEEAIEAAAAGPQSLLLEEQASGAVGAVPYSGSVEWARGSDELGHPTITAHATIPARNLDLDLLIRRNADTNLPASHLMEVNFKLAESFVGGSIANLPGVLLKDEELVQGQPLTGASARIVGNSFLFALSSASERDVEANVALLRDRSWIDLAMVYGTGRRAILTLEKSEEGAAIFDEVMAAWDALDAESAAEAETEAE